MRSEFNGDAFQLGKMKAVDGGVSCPLRICLVYVKTKAGMRVKEGTLHNGPGLSARRLHNRCICTCTQRLCGIGRVHDPTDCSPPGSSVHGIPQARILEWAAIL